MNKKDQTESFSQKSCNTICTCSCDCAEKITEPSINTTTTTNCSFVAGSNNEKPRENRKKSLTRAAYDLEDNCEELLNSFFEQRKALIRLQVKVGVVEADAEDIMFELEDIRRKLMEQDHKVVNLENRVRKRLKGVPTSSSSTSMALI